MPDAKRKTISKSTRQALYEKYNKRCAYCGYEITYANMQIDHKIAVNSGIILPNEELNNINNLLPACKQCNFYKSTFLIDQFRDRLLHVLIPNLQKLFIYRLALKYGLIEEHIADKIVFYFEKDDKNDK